MSKAVAFIHTGKGNPVFLTDEQGQAAERFSEKSSSQAPVFLRKILLILNTDLLCLRNESYGFHINKVNINCYGPEKC